MYPNTTVYNPIRKCNSTFSSWQFTAGPSLGNGGDLDGVTFLAPDFNTRQKAPPPCPGHSPVGGCGVPGVADLHDFPNGTLDWFKSRLGSIVGRPPALPTEERLPQPAVPASASADTGSADAPLSNPLQRRATASAPAAMPPAFMLTHQPFRCTMGVPDWYFCFSHPHKVTLMDAMDAAGASAEKWWGQLAGHQHRWFNGTSFDEPSWSMFRQWENSAVKGDATDTLEASSFALITVENKVVQSTIQKWWTESGVWHHNF